MNRTWTTIKQTISNFMEDDCLSLAGALAFYTVLSLAPLIVILLNIASLLGEGTQQQFVSQIQQVVGPQAGEAIKGIVDSADQQPGWGSIAGIISLLILLFSASGVFAQLQASLNRIWDVQAKPSAGVFYWIQKRLLSFGMVLGIAFLLLVSLAVSAAIGLIVPHEGFIWQLVTVVVSMAVFTLLFALMFKYLPDVKIQWRDVWLGAIVTAFLFGVGKFGISLYLGKSGVASSYGAAGSLLILLLWVYYSSLLVFLGAEFTQVQARLRGSPIEPNEHAEWEPTAKKLRPA